MRATRTPWLVVASLALWPMSWCGCSRPPPQLVTGCFAAVTLEARDFAQQSGGSELYVWALGNNAGDDLLERFGFVGHLLALPGPSAQTALSASAQLRLTGRVVKVFPSSVERHLGRQRAHELAEAVVNGRRYVLHATRSEAGWNASLPPRCKALGE